MPGGTEGRRRWRRALRVALLALGALVVAGALGVLALLATNPRAASSPGWRRHASLPGGRGEVASTVVRDDLWVIGGFSGAVAGTSREVEVYDPAADSWREAAELPEARHHAAAAALDGTVYVAGGAPSATDWAPRRDVWALRGGAWEGVEPLPEGRLGHDLVALDGRLYVLGGSGASTDVLVYEPGSGWERRAGGPDHGDHLRAVVVGEEIWVLGGRRGRVLERVSVLDPAPWRWRRGPALPFGTSAMALGMVDGRVHVVGGEDPDLAGGRVLRRHVSLAPGEATWRREPDPLVAVHGAAHGVLGGRLYVTGGSRRQGALSSLAWTGITQSFAPDPASR